MDWEFSIVYKLKVKSKCMIEIDLTWRPDGQNIISNQVELLVRCSNRLIGR